MQNLPEKVEKAFVELRGRYPFLIVLRRTNGHFYVYKASSRWDKKTKKVKSAQEYKGRIMPDGTFIEKKASYKEIEFEKAKAIIEANGGTINFTEPQTSVVIKNRLGYSKIDGIDKKILTYLSMNARAHVPVIARTVNLSISATKYRIKQLEKRLGIKYILEIDPTQLGYTPYLALIKFEGDPPSLNELNEAMNSEPKIQFAVSMQGDYDVIAYLLDFDIVQVIDNFYKFITKTTLGKYGARWNLVPFATAYSFMPTTQAFVERVLTDKIQKKVTGHVQRENKLTEHEFIVLKELNENSVKPFSDIDAKYGFDNGTARYIYHRLIDKKIVVRPTINITNAPVRYIGVIVIADIHWETIDLNRHRLLLDIVENVDLLNKYNLSCNVGAPWGSIIFVPISSSGKGLDNIAKEIGEELGGGSVVKSFIVRDLLVGSLCYRRFDNVYSRQYRILIESGKMKPKKIVNYDLP